MYLSYEDEYEEALPSFPYDANTVESNGTASFEKPVTDNLIHAKVNLPQGEKIQGDKVIRRKKYPNGDTVGKYNDNPLSNSLLHVN